MCGRYNIIPDAKAWVDVSTILGGLIAEAIRDQKARYNIAPTQLVPIVIGDGRGGSDLVQARWGFVPEWWSKPTLPPMTTNARADDTARNPRSMWHAPLRFKRCLIPASGWYEWLTLETGKKPVKLPHHIQRADGKEIMFAGIYSFYRPTPESEGFHTCAIMTLPSAADLAEIHEREPVVLQGEYWLEWLNPAMTDKGRALEILETGGVHHLTKQQVSRYVSNSRNEGEQCIEPVEHPESLDLGLVRYTDEQLQVLRTQPIEEFLAVHQERLQEWETPEERPTIGEVHLWMREARERPDADQLQDFVDQCLRYIRQAGN